MKKINRMLAVIITATVLIALACAIQADAFKKLHGSPYATIMCTANLRSRLVYVRVRQARDCRHRLQAQASVTR